MTSPAPQRRGRLAALLRWSRALLWFLIRALVLLWSTLAIHYSNLPWPWARTAAAGVFLVFGVWALWLAPRRGRWLFAAAFAALLVWWSTIQPSQERNWRPEVAVLPRAVIDGDRVRLTGVRDFTYRSRHDFTVRYVDREVELSHLVAVDFFVSFWMPGPIGHTFVSFVFDNAPPLSISIETRPEVGETFAPVASLFKQFELIYVVGSEPDVVGSRTSHRGEEVFLYRILTDRETARRLFLVYLDRINQLADHPEWYHLLSNNCTINIIRYANAAGRHGRLDWRHVLNGLIDRYLYATGRIDTSLPFAELRQRSHINRAARAADGAADFSDRIRAGLPAMDR
ncbi:DUF4105 domain-containing protein [bacterium]|nr:DUF4105 domain-containing protein [bacterium]